ncbi:DUF6879 family protein [Streptomyces sp. NPDC058439]|uniref:DUF6879 family protein n=1 Tax=Streptomyces sp. NPDC058439 TaxID=3346500 RepID=UPI003655F2BE
MPELITNYIRFEHTITDANLRAGEEIPWLGCRRASTLALPCNDFWLIDDQIVRALGCGMVRFAGPPVDGCLSARSHRP